MLNACFSRMLCGCALHSLSLPFYNFSIQNLPNILGGEAETIESSCRIFMKYAIYTVLQNKAGFLS